MDTITQTKVRTHVGTAVLGAAIILAAAAGLVIKSQDSGLAIGASGYDFGKVMTQETAAKVFILQNTENAGDYKLGITPLAGAFAINQESSTCQAILSAGQSCKLAVKFTPAEAIKYKATLSIRYVFNGKTKGATVKLQGEGVLSSTDVACLDSDVTENNFAGMPSSVYKFVNVFKFGHVKGLNPTTGAFMEADDKCWNEKRILEYYCDAKKGTVSWNSYDCPSGCADGACQEVICPEAPANAKGLSVNGVCSWECLSPWENQDGQKENGCECNLETKQGCPVAQCYDSDGGIVLEKMGMTQGLNPKTNVMAVVTDSCSSIFQVVEYACQGDYLMVDAQAPGEPPLSSAGTFCPKGTYCKDNACQPCQKKDLGYTTCQNFGGKYYAADMMLGDDCSIYATNSVDGLKLCGNTADSCVEGKCVVVSIGSLKVEYAGDNPAPAQLLAGTTGNEIVRYKMTAMGEDVAISSLPLYYTGKVGYVSAVKLFLDGKQFGESGGYALAEAKQTINLVDGALILKKEVPAILSIKLDFYDKTVVETSTVPLKIGIADGDGDYTDWDGKAEGYYSINAAGLASGQLLDKTKIDATGDGAGGAFGSNPFTLHRGLLKVSLDSGSAGGASKQGKGSDLLKVKLAAVGDDIQVNDIEFVANGTCKPNGSTGTNLRSNDMTVLYAEWDSANSLNGEMPRTWSLSANEKDLKWNEPLIIAAGEAKVLRLTGETTGCKTNEFMSVSVSAPSSGAATKAGIEYQDSSGVNIDMKTTKNLPVNGNALIY
ncbi:hypothetical protein A2482_03370 [Candidatus Falkowbacteria bacterium RIFOXYC2_FULL_48_21]|uniref:HYDIN/VesB/CFA65-like Ig-like domain-containing protein n=1 Tax=Candidatus Falkowbacteria bacterium RIFOXYC2_FULL_48_21 TaxID=1798005 RepID=A0A1F5TBW5_9BACT|nr:MAG: hypothetical protein A2482_03370 [Candidatus Falkowbacteria bacterium RIFOXYC2_FULL_48_21]